LETYVILRRGAWLTHDELHYAAIRSSAEAARTPADVSWIRSYVLAESDGSLGTVCVYQASGPEAIRTHGYRAGLPVDEIAASTGTVILNPDPGANAGPHSPA
jgi:Protein of unknown function (DUF4242)